VAKYLRVFCLIGFFMRFALRGDALEHCGLNEGKYSMSIANAEYHTSARRRGSKITIMI
jgi:hypothetical protein